jgi:hypothetical protein
MFVYVVEIKTDSLQANAEFFLFSHSDPFTNAGEKKSNKIFVQCSSIACAIALWCVYQQRKTVNKNLLKKQFKLLREFLIIK